jgi:hypothetical protein
MKIANVVYSTLFKLKATIPNTIKLTTIDYSSTETERVIIRSETVSSTNFIDSEQRVVILNNETIPLAKIIK